MRGDDPSQCLPEDTHSQAAHGWIEFAWSGHGDPGMRPELAIRRRNY